MSSFVRYPGDGVTTDFAVSIRYQAQSEVFVSVSGVDTAFEWINASLIKIDPAPAASITSDPDNVRIYRTTKRNALRRVVPNSGVLKGTTINNQGEQALMVAEEAYDRAQDALAVTDGVADMENQFIGNLADPINDQDAANKRYVDTTFAADLAAVQASVSGAQTAQLGAETAQASAETAKSSAETAATNAETAEANAATSAAAALAAETSATNYVSAAQAELGLGRMPIGTVLWIAGSTPPVSTLVLNGQTVSRTTYADFWAWVQTSGNLAASEGAKEIGQFGPGDGSTTFSLPDIEDMFIRSTGDSRQVGSYQEDAFQHFEGTLGNYSSIGFTSSQLDGVFTTDGSSKANRTSGETGTTYKAKIDPSIQARTAAETRPKNVAYVPVIVAYHQVIDAAQLQASQALTDISNNASGLATAQSDISTLQGQQLGIGQTWSNPGRTAGLWYQNTDAKPMMVGLRGGSNGAASLDYSLDGSTAVLTFNHNSVNGAQLWNTIIIPPGHYYRFGGFHSNFFEFS